MKKWLIVAGMLVCGQALAGIDIDLTNSGAQVQAKDTVRLRNVNVTGFGNYYVDFKWDAEKMVLVPVRADKDTLSQFAATAKRYSASKGSVPDLNQACVQEFGAQYQQADWSDVKSAVGTDTNALQSFKNTIAMVSSQPLYIKYGGQASNSDGYVYAIKSGGTGSYDTVQADLGLFTAYALTNGGIYSISSNQVICVKTGNTSPFVK